ncbi:MAG: A24 family peptidase [Clostridiales bacterium]|nr:A24 family peptidase [Clostridiales bacterium]
MREFIPVYISVIILFVAAVFDLTTDRISNALMIVGIAAGVVVAIFPSIGSGWTGFLAGLAIPFLIGWIPFHMGALGAGDVKLLMVIGCINGGEQVLYCIFFSFLLAAGFSLVRLSVIGQFRRSLANIFRYFQNMFVGGGIDIYQGRYGKGHTIHFSVAIFFGYVLWLGVYVCRTIL